VKRLREAFLRLPAEHQRRWALGASVVVTLSVITLIAALVPEPRKLEPRKVIVKNLLTDADPRALGLDGLASELREIRKGQEALTSRLNSLEERRSPEDESTGPLPSSPSAIQSEIAALKSELEALRKHQPPEDKTVPMGNPSDLFPPLPTPKPPSKLAAADLDALIPGSPHRGIAQGNLPSGSSGTIRVIRNPESQSAAVSKITTPQSPDGVYIPAGSLISGYLLNGLDAPTGTHARKEPFPVLVRVKEEAILPNRYRADLRECFLIASGYGDLSAERAYIRAEVFSCIRSDGGVIEVPLDAYAVGEDGKLGLRGRIIDKQGQLMAESLAAGFAKGFSNLFSRVQVPVLMAGGQGSLSSSVPFQSAFSEAAAEGAILKGTGSALDRLANYYMDMAENLFPVVEIDVTRRIEFVVQHGTELRIGPPKESKTPTSSRLRG
jgi:conjugal transfer pilus assembly protein TraB